VSPMASALANGLSKSFVALASVAGKLLTDPEGPRLAAISYDGWDTHANEGAAEGRLSNLLSAFDASLAALRTAMAPVWADTAVVVMTDATVFYPAFANIRGCVLGATLAAAVIGGG
jgi:uncharacterized protein (DUF1501 family)